MVKVICLRENKVAGLQSADHSLYLQIELEPLSKTGADLWVQNHVILSPLIVRTRPTPAPCGRRKTSFRLVVVQYL